jgi:HK97 family phage portal protein
VPVTRLGPFQNGKLTDSQVIAKAAQVAKAQSDLGVVGEAMSGAAISTALGSAGRAWQQKLLQDAAIHWFLYKKNPWVRTCVDLIAQRATADDYAIESAAKNKATVDAFQTVLNQINPRQSLTRILRGLYRDFQVNGNWYCRVQYKGTLPVALYRIDFRTIAPVPVKVGFPEFYSIYTDGRNDLIPLQIPAAEILHLTWKDGGENGCGLSPLESLDNTLAVEQAIITFNQGFLSNGAKAGDIYAMDPNMSPEQIDREREMLVENFTKPSQAYSPLFVQGIQLVRDGSKIAKDMDYGDFKQWNRTEVLAVYSVPVSLVTDAMGALGATGKEQDQILFTESVVAPLQKQTFEDLNRELVQNRYLNADLTLIPPKTAGVRLDLVKTAGEMLKAGSTGNEARRVMRLDGMPTGYDQPIFQLGPATVIGEPGSTDAVILTAKGAVTGDAVDPTDIPDDTGAASSGGTGASGSKSGSKGTPDAKASAARKKVSKADDDDAIQPEHGRRTLPPTVGYSDADRRLIGEMFADAFPELAGLLDAR